MSRIIAKAFARGKAFIPFITCGDPDLATTAPQPSAPWRKTARTSSSWAFPSPTPPPKARHSGGHHPRY